MRGQYQWQRSIEIHVTMMPLFVSCSSTVVSTREKRSRPWTEKRGHGRPGMGTLPMGKIPIPVLPSQAPRQARGSRIVPGGEDPSAYEWSIYSRSLSPQGLRREFFLVRPEKNRGLWVPTLDR